MHNKLFADPREWDNTSTEIALAAFGRYADVIGLDGAALQQCVRDNETLAEVEGDFNEARRLGITGTPTFVINNKLLSGAQPTEIFVQIVEGELRAQ
jgi:predicted DsbA family dithiol-disulfide isomerase